MSRAAPDGTGIALLLAGAALMWIAWQGRTTGGLLMVEAAAVGPLSAALGVGVLLHGAALPRYGMSRLTRLYGLLGGLAGGAYLWLVTSLGAAPAGRARWLLPLALTAIWLVPMPSEGRRPGSGAPQD